MKDLLKYSVFHCVVALGIVAITLTSCGRDDDSIVPSKEPNEENTDLGSRKEMGDGLHEYVDLGLPSGTLWAKTNIGAVAESDNGDYFAWGETMGYMSGKTTFDWSMYKWCNGNQNSITKYCVDNKFGTTDSKTILDSEDDAATVNWGDEWCIPTRSQIQELTNDSYTTTEWTKVNNVYGRKITSKKNGNYIFLPACGFYALNAFHSVGQTGLYWSSSLRIGMSEKGFCLVFDSPTIVENWSPRSYGHCIRPVRVSASQK